MNTAPDLTHAHEGALDHTRRMASHAMERAGEKMGELRTGMRGAASRGYDSMTEAAMNAQRHLGQYARATQRYVSDEPLKAALIAAAVGAVVAGVIIALRRDRSDF